MKKIFFLCLFAILAIFGCEDDVQKIEVGDLNVKVTINEFQPAEDAEIYTKPSSKQGTTDEFGSALLTELETGSYEVFATLVGVGSGKTVANIKAGELTDISINITLGVHVGIAPNVTIVLPAFPASFSEGDEITFSAVVEDSDTPLQNISVTWESNLDGVIHSGSPDTSGNILFSTRSLSRGIHIIEVRAEDDEGYSSTRSFEVSTLVPAAITLYEPIKENGTVTLNWTEYPNSDFQKFDVFRSDGDCSSSNQTWLATISDKSITSFTDQMPPFEMQVCYFVRISNTDSQYRDSNTETVDMPGGYVFNFTASDMLKHPAEKVVYLIDKGGQKLIKFDYINDLVLKETNLQGEVGNCDIGDNGFGVEIYVPSQDGWIYVYDANDLSQTTAINAGLRIGSVVVNGLGHVIASVYPSPWWEQPVRTYARSNGINIDGNGDHEGDRLRMIPGKNELISISTSVSPVDMEYFKLNGDGTFALHSDDSYHGDYPLNASIFRVSADGSYAITTSSGAVYTANSTMEYRGQLQRGALEFSDFAFSNDGSIIYAATSNRNSIQMGHYPSLTRSDEFLTKGYPVFIIKDGTQIIALSKSSENSITSGIEIIDLP